MFKNFIKDETNKILLVICAISLIIHFSYKCTMKIEEWFTGADAIYEFFSLLSVSFIGGFIFYFLQVYIPEYKKKVKMKENVNYYLHDILDTMNHLYVDICHDYLGDRINLINTVITQSQFEKIETKFKLNDKVVLDCGKIELTYYEYILRSINKIEKHIDKIYVRLGIYLDEEIKLLLVDITNSSLHCYFEEVDIGYTSCIYWGQITKYYELYRRLYNYLDENK